MSLTYPEDRSYHSEHLWAKAEPDGTMLVGITDYAQDQLGGVIFVDLPAVGEHFKQGVSCASIESVKITSDAIIPVSGEIVAVNEALADAPELLNDSPYDKGWLVRVKPDDADEGGRISAATAVVGGMLGITPILNIRDGVVEAAGKSRGRKGAYQWMEERIKKEPVDTALPVAFGHSDAPAVMAECEEYFRARIPGMTVYESDIGAVVGTHAGPGCAGIAYFVKE